MKNNNGTTNSQQQPETEAQSFAKLLGIYYHDIIKFIRSMTNDLKVEMKKSSPSYSKQHMRKNIFPRVIFWIVLFGAFCPSSGVSSDVSLNFSGGNGSRESPYRIASVQDLTTLSDRVSRGAKSADDQLYSTAHYLQVADIDLSSVPGWNPIGATKVKLKSGRIDYFHSDSIGEWDTPVFSGVYDGNGHKVSNIRFDETTMSGVRRYGKRERDFDVYGFFGVISGDGETKGIIKNVQMENSFPSLNWTVDDVPESFGILAGYMVSGNMENCSVRGNINIHIISPDISRKKAYTTHIGGIAGKVEMGNITNCISRNYFYVSSDIYHATQFIGGILGEISERSSVTNCRNEGDIVSFSTGDEKQFIGGIAASVSNGKNFFRCSNDGNITINHRGLKLRVGGLFGFFSGSLRESANNGHISLES